MGKKFLLVSFLLMIILVINNNLKKATINTQISKSYNQIMISQLESSINKDSIDSFCKDNYTFGYHIYDVMINAIHNFKIVYGTKTSGRYNSQYLIFVEQEKDKFELIQFIDFGYSFILYRVENNNIIFFNGESKKEIMRINLFFFIENNSII